MPDEQPPEVDPDRRGAKALLYERADAKRREAILIDRVAGLVERGAPLGDLYVGAWVDYARDGSSINMETAIVSGVNLEIAEAVITAYLKDPSEFADGKSDTSVNAIVEQAIKRYERGLLMPAGQPSAPPPGIPTLVATSRTFEEFRTRVCEAIDDQVREDGDATGSSSSAD